jgi:uncharacterized damage-inducible protein DinB
MAMKDALIAEIKQEAVNTRKMLERADPDKFDWKPHEKSMTLGRLAAHIAEIPVWVNRTMEAEEYDFMKNIVKPVTYSNTAELLKVFEERQTAVIAALQNATDEMLNIKYKLKRGTDILAELPRKVLIRNFVFSHLAHHRGQLSVYLRMLDIPVPGMYGPSADEK